MDNHASDQRAEGALFDLFVYGSFLDPQVFTLITGETPPREPATLPDYDKVTALASFPFVVKRPGGAVTGQVLSRLPLGALTQVDHFEGEGELYVRQEVEVETPRGRRRAFTYVAGPYLLAAEPPPEAPLEERLSEFIQSRIVAALADGVPGEKRIRDLRFRAKAELLGNHIEELVREYFDHGPIQPVAVKHLLAATGLPSLTWLGADRYARKYAPAYLKLVIKAIVFNQTEARIYRDFKGVVRTSQPYYERAVSAAATFQFLADNLGPIDKLTASLGVAGYDADLEYIDYAVAAIFISDELYRVDRLEPYIERIKAKRQPAAVPLGCEVEFSPLGRDAVGAAPDEDPAYDGFYYFDDFDLGARLWKVGGHVDDHRSPVEGVARGRGFLEFAFGRYRVAGDIATPVTSDPVLLSDLINAAVAFAEIKPHILHLTLGLEEGRPVGPPPPLEYLICLLILGGDLNVDDQGVLREKRIYFGEITDALTGLGFSRVGEYRSSESDATPARVISYQFPRLFFEHSYGDLIMALKGFQLATNPPALDVSPGAEHGDRNRALEKGLIRWAAAPVPLPKQTITGFLDTVRRGFAYEAALPGGLAGPVYDKWLALIDERLNKYNDYLRGGK